MSQESLLRPGEVAKALGVSVRTVAKYEDQGLLKAEKTRGGHRRFAADEVRRFLKKRQKPVGITFPEMDF